MATQRQAAAWAALTAGALFFGMAWAQKHPSGPSIPTVYCATVNTGSDMTAINSNYQSDGRCFNNCTDLGYALAILQNKNCWCSNLIPHPDDQKPLKDCQLPCPGYPPDHCGGDGVYGYLEVSDFSPSGTAAPGGETSQPTKTSSSVPTTSSTSSLSSAVSTSSSSSSSTSSEPGSSASPSVVIVTVGGTVQTVTATPTPGNSDSSSGGLAGGAIAGIVIGVLGAIGVAAFFAWMWWSRHKKDESDKNPLGSPVRSPGGSPSLAHTPQMADMSDGRYAASAASGQAAWDSNRRRSHLMPVDPRLDPFIYSSDHNRSRESFTSLQDNQDYSRRVHQPQRVLRAVNPDPEED